MNDPTALHPQLPPPLTGERLLADTLAIPGRVRQMFPALVDAVGRALADADVSTIDEIFLGGSGDLFHSALATELAFQRLTRVRTVAMPSMRLGNYYAPGMGARSLVIAMSFSGLTARAVEAATLAAQAGAQVWALTHSKQSPLVEIARHCIVKPDTGGNEAAGYPVTMLLLYLAAVRIAELRATLSAADAAAIRQRLADAAESMERTLDVCAAPAAELARRFATARYALFLGSGPTYGSAVNGAARVLEAAGINASAQDIEEWAHLERWVEETASPCLVIAPAGPARERAGEILDALRALGKPGIAIVPAADTVSGAKGTAWLPVHCALPGEFSPLVYNLPGELFAHRLGIEAGAAPYRAGNAAYQRLGEIRWGGFVRRALPDAGIGLRNAPG